MGPTSQIWVLDRPRALALFATMPSPRLDAALLRSAIRARIFGPGFQSVLTSDSALAPTIHVAQNAPFDLSTAHVTYVGMRRAHRPSPWSCPCPGQYSPDFAREVARSRPDYSFWLRRLSGLALWCDCPGVGKECWAQFLVDEFDAILVADLSSECGTPCLEDPMGEQTDDDGPDEIGPPNVVGVADAICSSSSSLTGIPAPIEWPESWTAFVSTVRNARGPLFLECVAGTEVMTNEMKSAGWETAPPH